MAIARLIQAGLKLAQAAGKTAKAAKAAPAAGPQTFQRTYTAGAKAGTTEVVTNTQRATQTAKAASKTAVRAPTAKQQAAKTYQETFGSAPSPRMTAKQMTDSVVNTKARIKTQDAMMDRLLVGEKASTNLGVAPKAAAAVRPATKAPTAARKQAAKAYEDVFKSPPPPRMSAKAMREKIELRKIIDNRQKQRSAQVSDLF